MKYVNFVRNLSEKSKKRLFRARYFWIAFLSVIVLAGAVLFSAKVSVFDPISIVASVAGSDLKETDGRTNVLMLGSDKRVAGDLNSALTDTILVVSIGRVEKNVVLISLPRDLWVESPMGYRAKLNAIYAYGGGDEMSQVVQNVLGVPVHYWAVIDFGVFKNVVDILGGVEIEVEKSFDDLYYPVEGKEDAPVEERYEFVHFDAGKQVMDGDAALKYVRSRKGDNGEGTDFARSKRQQNVIMAIKDRVLSFATLMDIPKLKELYDAYSRNVDTDMDFVTTQSFYLLSRQIDFDNVRSVVLDDRSAANAGGLLYAPVDKSLYGDVYVLVPRVGDFSQIHAYVQRYIFGESF